MSSILSIVSVCFVANTLFFIEVLYVFAISAAIVEILEYLQSVTLQVRDKKSIIFHIRQNTYTYTYFEALTRLLLESENFHIYILKKYHLARFTISTIVL
jgi:hypothetical protein